MSKKVVTYGTFDLFHVGHVRLLERLAKLGDELIVFVSTDEFNSIKGKTCVMPYEQRAELVGACKYVSKVMPEKAWEQKRSDILRERAAILAMGDDWAGKFDEFSDICEVVYLPRTEDISSTSLKATIADMAKSRQAAEEAAKTSSAKPEVDLVSVFSEILSLAQTGKLNQKAYRSYLALLTDTEDPKDMNWLRCWILLNCLARKKAARTQMSIAKLDRISRRRGKADEFKTFMTLLFDDLGLLRPIGSKYSESFAGKDVAAILAECGRVAEKLEEEGLQIFANSGTLLGLVREGKLLAHDNDIDLAVLLSARSEAEAAAEWLALCDRMIADGRAVSRSEWSGVTLKLHKILNFGVDLFPAWIDDQDRLFIFPHTHGKLTREQLLPFKREPLSGLKLPKDAAAVLVSNYGEDWARPAEGWSFNWVAARETFASFLARMRPEDAGKFAAGAES